MGIDKIIRIFCSYSTDFKVIPKKVIDNIFLNDLFPCDGAKFFFVYIYWIYLCNITSFDNSFG